MENMIPIYASIKTLCQLFDIGKTKMYELVNEFELGGGSFIKDGRVHRVNVREFTEWLERRTML
jgi:hypothetical protein